MNDLFRNPPMSLNNSCVLMDSEQKCCCRETPVILHSEALLENEWEGLGRNLRNRTGKWAKLSVPSFAPTSTWLSHIRGATGLRSEEGGVETLTQAHAATDPAPLIWGRNWESVGLYSGKAGHSGCWEQVTIWMTEEWGQQPWRPSCGMIDRGGSEAGWWRTRLLKSPSSRLRQPHCASSGELCYLLSFSFFTGNLHPKEIMCLTLW